MTEPLLIIFGASGAGRRVVDIALDVLDTTKAQYSSVAVLDDSPTPDNLARLRKQGVRYLGTRGWLEGAPPSAYSIGIGDPNKREELSALFRNHGHVAPAIISPNAYVSRTALIGDGCVISPGANLSTNTSLGQFVHVMANAAISHDVAVDDYVNINPGAIVAGNCHISRGTTIGAGAVILQGITIGANATIGAGAVVTRDVKDGATVKGMPAR